MGLLELFVTSSVPVLNVLLVTCVGSILATNRVNILGKDARKHLNNIIFFVFNPSLVSINLAKTITFQSLVLLWFMPINVFLNVTIGSALGWILIQITKAPVHLRGLILGCCSAGNVGNILFVLIPTMCKEKGSPFGAPDICHTYGLAYCSLSMAVKFSMKIKCFFGTFLGTINLKKLLAPSTIGVIVGFIVGVIPPIRKLLIGETAPLRMVQGSAAMLGDGAIPTVTLIMGGNLTKGLRRSDIQTSLVVGIIVIRYVVLPLIGVVIVKGAIHLGLVHSDPLFQFILLVQYAVPPAMNIGTITQLFGVGESECSVIFLWSYGLASVSLTLWCTVFMWLLF